MAGNVNTMYRWVAVFNKTFTDGFLRGLTVDSATPYPTKKAAEAHIKVVKNGGEDVLTGNKWKASNCRVLPIQRVTKKMRARHGIEVPQ